MLVVIFIVSVIGYKQLTRRDQIFGGERISLISTKRNIMLH